MAGDIHANEILKGLRISKNFGVKEILGNCPNTKIIFEDLKDFTEFCSKGNYLKCFKIKWSMFVRI